VNTVFLWSNVSVDLLNIKSVNSLLCSLLSVFVFVIVMFVCPVLCLGFLSSVYVDPCTGYAFLCHPAILTNYTYVVMAQSSACTQS